MQLLAVAVQHHEHFADLWGSASEHLAA